MSKLYYDKIGHGPDVVLLHGWGLHSHIWQTLVAELKNDFCLHIIDLPGCGKSKHVDPFPASIESLAEIILEKMPQKAAWIGWSLGGLVASFVAHAFPERVQQLVTITSTPKFVADDTEQWPGLSPQALTQFAEDLTIQYEQTLFRFFSLQWYGIPGAKHWLKQLEPFFMTEKPEIAALQHQLNILQKTDLRQAWKKITCPTLHILGRLDAIVPERLHSKLKELVPHHQTYVMPKAAHLPFLTHQSEFLQNLNLFLNTNL